MTEDRESAPSAPRVGLEGQLPESWCCVDCLVNTGPGLHTRADMERALEAPGEWRTGPEIAQMEGRYDADTEVFTVRDAVWNAAGMAPMGGCLCIRCLEKR